METRGSFGSRMVYILEYVSFNLSLKAGGTPATVSRVPRQRGHATVRIATVSVAPTD